MRVASHSLWKRIVWYQYIKILMSFDNNSKWEFYIFGSLIPDNLFGKTMARDRPFDKKLSKLDKNDKVMVILMFNDPKL